MPLYRRSTGANQLPSYIVYLRGGLYVAQNTLTGLLDFSNADFATAMNSTTSALSATGGSIGIKNGSYTVNTPISIAGSSITIRGESWNTVLNAKNALNESVFKFNSASAALFGCSIRDLKINGNAANQSSGDCINANGAVQCLFDYLYITSFYDYGIDVSAIVAGGTGHHNRITNSLFDHGADSAGGGRALHFVTNDENHVFNCDFETNGGTAGDSQILDEAGINSYIGNVFVGGLTGIYANSCNKNIYSGNSFDGVNGHCIKIKGSHHVINGNVMFNISGTATANTYSGVILETGDKNTVVNNLMTSSNTNGQTESFVRDISSGKNLISTNNLQIEGTVGTAPIEVTPSNTLVRNNLGFITENQGTATVANGSTTIVVSHGLDYTPAAGDVVVTPTNSMGSATKFFVGTYTSSQFTITVNTDPGATTATFAWSTRRK